MIWVKGEGLEVEKGVEIGVAFYFWISYNSANVGFKVNEGSFAAAPYLCKQEQKKWVVIWQ